MFDEHYSFRDFFSKLCRALPGRLVRKGPQSCLGQEMKADIRSGASFLKPWAPGLPCTDPRFPRSMHQHAWLWSISESLDPILVLGRNHCAGPSVATAMIHCELLPPILILLSIEDDKEPLAFSSSWHLWAPLATLRAFWSLEPQACLVKTYIRQKQAATPKFMMHKQSIRPHFAVLSSFGDDQTWIQYEALLLWSMKAPEACSNMLCYDASANLWTPYWCWDGIIVQVPV